MPTRVLSDLAKLRRQLLLTQAQAAKGAGVSQQTWSKYEAQVLTPHPKSRERILEFLNARAKEIELRIRRLVVSDFWSVTV